MSYKLAETKLSEDNPSVWCCNYYELDAERSGRVAELEKAITMIKKNLPNYDSDSDTYRLEGDSHEKKVRVEITDLMLIMNLLRGICEKDEGKTK